MDDQKKQKCQMILII